MTSDEMIHGEPSRLSEMLRSIMARTPGQNNADWWVALDVAAKRGPAYVRSYMYGRVLADVRELLHALGIDEQRLGLLSHDLAQDQSQRSAPDFESAHPCDQWRTSLRTPGSGARCLGEVRTLTELSLRLAAVERQLEAQTRQSRASATSADLARMLQK